MSTADVLNLVWPLVFLLCFLLVLQKVQEQMKPVITSMVTGLSANAARNGPRILIAVGFGLSASLAAFYDVFNALTQQDIGAMSWHQYMALWTKVMNPFIVAVLAYVTQSNLKPDSTNGTNPPFATKTNSPST